jgi:ppGpp synthetase/RelA/SpoT-type nucleotidyltranferase
MTKWNKRSYYYENKGVIGKGSDITEQSYPAMFRDCNNNGIPDVDDPALCDDTVTDPESGDKLSIEETLISDQLRHIIAIRREMSVLGREYLLPELMEAATFVAAGNRRSFPNKWVPGTKWPKVEPWYPTLPPAQPTAEAGTWTLANNPYRPIVTVRTKTPYSIMEKLIRGRIDLRPKTDDGKDEKKGPIGIRALTDITGGRITCPDFKTCQAARDIVDNMFDVAQTVDANLQPVSSEEDFYALPQHGYRAFHFIVRIQKYMMEVQVRTQRQGLLADASHEPYKKGSLDMVEMDRLSSLVHRADQGKLPKAEREQLDEYLTRPVHVLQQTLSIKKR